MDKIKNAFKEPEDVATVAMAITLILAVATVAYSLWQAFEKAGVS